MAAAAAPTLFFRLHAVRRQSPLCYRVSSRAAAFRQTFEARAAASFLNYLDLQKLLRELDQRKGGQVGRDVFYAFQFIAQKVGFSS